MCVITLEKNKKHFNIISVRLVVGLTQKKHLEGIFSILSPGIEPGATEHMRCDLEIQVGQGFVSGNPLAFD